MVSYTLSLLVSGVLLAATQSAWSSCQAIAAMVSVDFCLSQALCTTCTILQTAIPQCIFSVELATPQSSRSCDSNLVRRVSKMKCAHCLHLWSSHSMRGSACTGMPATARVVLVRLGLHIWCEAILSDLPQPCAAYSWMAVSHLRICPVSQLAF